MADSISEWQNRLERDGSVKFAQTMRRVLALFVISLLFVVVGAYTLVTDGLALWAVGSVLLFGLGMVIFGHTIVVGAPAVTVTRTGLIRSGLREVGFSEICELITGKDVFGFYWTPRPGEELRRSPKRHRGLRYATVPPKSVSDPDLLAQWVLHLKDPSGEIISEPRYRGIGTAWRLADSGV